MPTVAPARTVVIPPTASPAPPARAPAAANEATPHEPDRSRFVASGPTPVQLTATAAAPVATDGPTARVLPGATGLVASGPAPKSGAELAADTVRFMEAHLESRAYQEATWNFPGAPNKPLADAVRRDALEYIERTPGLKESCAAMIDAAGAHPAKVEGLRVDFALNHFATEGAARGLRWGGTEAQVKQMLAASAEEAAHRSPVLRDTEGKSGVDLHGAVVGSVRTVVNVDGANNTVDFCTQPYPSANARGDAILGGSGNSGQVDLVGTVVVRTGEQNRWTVKDPSTRPALNPPSSDLARLTRDQLAQNARGFSIILEGNAADWSVRTSRDEATYVNARSGTSVTIPSGAQGQVRYAATAVVDALAADLEAGRPVSPNVDPSRPFVEPTPSWLRPAVGGPVSPNADPSRPFVEPTPSWLRPQPGEPSGPVAPTAGGEAATPAGLDTLLDSMSAEQLLAALAAILGHSAGSLRGASLHQLRAVLQKALGARLGDAVFEALRAEAERSVESGREVLSTLDPMEWFARHTGRDLAPERARWAAEGKSDARVRGELGEWQLREGQRLLELGLKLGLLAEVLTGAGPDVADRLARHDAAREDAVRSARPHADGRWQRPPFHDLP